MNHIQKRRLLKRSRLFYFVLMAQVLPLRRIDFCFRLKGPLLIQSNHEGKRPVTNS